jgi:hypothetical protein
MVLPEAELFPACRFSLARQIAFAGFAAAARQIVGKPTPTASGQSQKL